MESCEVCEKRLISKNWQSKE